MFRFEQYELLILLAAIPLLLLIYFVSDYFRKRAISRWASSALMQRMLPERAPGWRIVKLLLLVLSVGLFSLALANPQWGNKKEKVKAKSSDVFIALDISQSMMAKDISPNRLERAKRISQKLITALKGERLGLILFAGEAYLQMPLSNDFTAAEMFVRSANTGQASTQGTAIEEAIDLAERAFIAEDKYQRALVIITDGESHDPKAIERARQARENGLIIYTVGVGTPEGGFIPVDLYGREDFKRNAEGHPVKTRMNEALMVDLAAAGGGKYFPVSAGGDLIPEIRTQLEKLEKREMETRSFTDYSSYFQYFLFFGILFLCLEFLLGERKLFGDRSKNWLSS